MPVGHQAFKLRHDGSASHRCPNVQSAGNLFNRLRELARIGKGKAETVWSNDEVMSSQYSTCVFHKGFLYGTHGREDFANGELRCLEAKTGKLQWSVKGSGVAHVILVGDQLLILNNEGLLYLAEASPKAFKPLAQASVSKNITRALPALSNGRFYFRDTTSAGGQLKCLAVR